jgi:phosphatidylglycerol---prolipoprotein diacylglyceryl transferase
VAKRRVGIFASSPEINPPAKYSVMPHFSLYGWLMVAGIVLSAAFWTRIARRDRRLVIIYFAALAGAFVGAKIVYLAAEGWMYHDSPQRWLIWATGKSIVGALLGGYAAVELAKKATGYHSATGDLFAVITPIGIIVGRIGCLVHGCCLGKPCPTAWYTFRDLVGTSRWPAVPAEILFNLVALTAILVLRAAKWFPGQLFHLYLFGYGFFRFLHEILRDTPTLASQAPITGYQLASLAVAGLGAWGFVRRIHTPIANTAN